MAVEAPAFEMNLEQSLYVLRSVCGCLSYRSATEVDHTLTRDSSAADPRKTVHVQTARRACRVGEEFGLEPGTLVTGKMVAALRQLGFKYVFDTDFAADLTIMKKAPNCLIGLPLSEWRRSVKLPILTSCCPAWVNFFEHHFPDLKEIPSTSPFASANVRRYC
jgi:NADP-reducing hydrogenase subunit HndD